jgi:hypothetical protein
MPDSDERPGGDGSRDGSDGEEWRFDPGNDEALDASASDAGADADADADEDEGWRFSLDDVDEDGVVRRSIEPGEPKLENVVFVVLGAIAMVVVVYQLYALLT